VNIVGRSGRMNQNSDKKGLAEIENKVVAMWY
jgi:hypothetical protein